jgi:hypothetical protein
MIGGTEANRPPKETDDDDEHRHRDRAGRDEAGPAVHDFDFYMGIW